MYYRKRITGSCKQLVPCSLRSLAWWTQTLKAFPPHPIFKKDCLKGREGGRKGERETEREIALPFAVVLPQCLQK